MIQVARLFVCHLTEDIIVQILFKKILGHVNGRKIIEKIEGVKIDYILFSFYYTSYLSINSNNWDCV